MSSSTPAADHVEVEKLGGLAGFGLPGSHLRSHGVMALTALSAADAKTLHALFHQPAAAKAPMPDGFRYRLTRHVAGASHSIEVHEAALPAVLRDCVSDELI
jgi:hypothetical protein